MSVKRFGKAQKTAHAVSDAIRRAFSDLRRKFTGNDSTVRSSVDASDGARLSWSSICVSREEKAVTEDVPDNRMQNITFRSEKRRLSIRIEKQTPLEPAAKVQRVSISGLRRVLFRDMPREVRKIGEATFSEVFVHNEKVYKIVPLGEDTSLAAFEKEARIFRIVSREEGVCRLLDAFVLAGRYPEEYLRAWDEFGEEENERPCRYTESQEYGVLVMEEGGESLETHRFESLEEVDRFLRDVVSAVANLERKYEFEHRDMHWGNVLIRNGRIGLIDFSLSRLMDGASTVYTDLNESSWLFEGNGCVDAQFSVYRGMRDACSRKWAEFTPMSNVLWLRYLADKAFGKNRFRGKRGLKMQYAAAMQSCSSAQEIEARISRM